MTVILRWVVGGQGLNDPVRAELYIKIRQKQIRQGAGRESHARFL